MGWTNVTADKVVANKPALLHGVVLLTSTTGGDVTVYEGQDSGSGRKIARFEGIANESRPVTFTPALRCERGIYVDVGSNVSEILILWEPL